eukprot:1187528-Rhodomonas_salina.1
MSGEMALPGYPGTRVGLPAATQRARARLVMIVTSSEFFRSTRTISRAAFNDFVILLLLVVVVPGGTRYPGPGTYSSPGPRFSQMTRRSCTRVPGTRVPGTLGRGAHHF